MTTKPIYFADFRLHVLEHIKEIEKRDYESHSLEWFLIKYLRRIEKIANPPSDRGHMENAIRALIRFYVDNLEETSDLGARCQRIYDEYRQCLRHQHQQKK